MPCMPKYTAMVYTTQMMTRIPMVRKLFSGMPSTRLKAMERRGVARENVVAVPARRAKYSCQVNEFTENTVHTFAQKRPACLGVLLFVPLAHMEHEAEGDSQNDVKAPWNRTPVKQGIGGCPVLHGPHVRDMGLACV